MLVSRFGRYFNGVRGPSIYRTRYAVRVLIAADTRCKQKYLPTKMLSVHSPSNVLHRHQRGSRLTVGAHSPCRAAVAGFVRLEVTAWSHDAFRYCSDSSVSALWSRMLTYICSVDRNVCHSTEVLTAICHSADMGNVLHWNQAWLSFMFDYSSSSVYTKMTLRDKTYTFTIRHLKAANVEMRHLTKGR